MRSQQHGQGQHTSRLLAGVAEATRRLLFNATFETAVNGALEAIATAANIDRIYILQHHKSTATQPTTATCPYEWTKPGVIRTTDVPGRFPMDLDAFGDWLSLVEAGKAVQGLTQHFSQSARELPEQDGALSLLVVPILIEGHCWGTIGFDDCTTERVWGEAEIAVLETAAASFAGALERRDNVAELARRDALLSSVNAAAQCLVATDELKQAIPEALRILGQGAAQDRVYVFENLHNSETGKIFWDIPFEWNGPGIPSSIEYGMHLPVPMSAFPPQITEPTLRGQSFHCLVRDLDGIALDLNEKAQALSLVGVPIIIEGQWWGVLGFDDCKTERVWSNAEIAVLETAAASIGSAIERDLTRKEREAFTLARAAELESHNQVLERRDRILQATAAASNELLNGEDFDTSVSEALKILGESLGFDRIAVGQQFNDLTGNTLGYIRFFYEWDAVGIPSQIEDFEEMTDFHWQAMGLEHWYEANLKGEAFSQIIDELPEPFRTLMQSVAVQSTHNVPIFIEGEFWGVFGIDHCHEKKLLSPVELTALKTAANCIGSAIARDRNRREREAVAQARVVELAERDRILEATAAAANVMLTEEDFDSAVNAALQIVGQGLAVDRVVLGQHTEPVSSKEVSYHRFLYEWDSDGISAQIEHPELAKITDEGVEQHVKTLKRGEVFGGVVDELQEPFRSAQKALGVQSTYAIPIRIDGQYWGMIGLDDCHNPTRRSEAELEALMTLANCVGSAIERDLTRKEREATVQTRAAELKAHNLELASRDRILEATAVAANVLLTDENFEAAFNQALQIIGEAVGTDRVGLAQHLADLTEAEPGHWCVIHEWYAPGVIPVAQIFYPDPMQGTYAGAEQLYTMHQQGKGFSLQTVQMDEPFRSGMAAAGVQTLHAVPIFLQNRYWGTAVFGDCRQTRQRSLAELAALQTVADCIGNAIDRDRIRKEREAATQARAVELKKNNEILSLRDRWLSATAAATEKLLSANDLKSAITPALQEIGESLEVDRVGVMYALDHDGQQVFEFFAEWIHPSQPVQSEHEELSAIPCSSIGEQHLNALFSGRWFGGDIESFPEPFRSGQKEIGVQSTYSVPIFIDGQFWGLVGIDHCREKKLLTETEIAVFQTIASCFASAIQRDQIRQAREAAERNILLERERSARERAAQLQSNNEILSLRDRWLGATAAAAEQLLSTDDLERAISPALQIIGESIGIDRTGILQVVERGGQKMLRVIAEWAFPGQIRQGEHRDLYDVRFDIIGESLIKHLEAGHWIGGDIEDEIFPEAFREGQKQLRVKSTYSVPIFVSGKFWGIIGIDHCREKKLLTETEIAVFQTIASCFASAIQRDQIRQARESAERAALIERERATRAAELEAANQVLITRDRWLETTATAANQLLSADITTSVNTALQTIGTNLESDRLGVMRYVPGTRELGYFQILYEWDSAGTAAQIDDLELHQVPASDVVEWTRNLMGGQPVGGPVEEQLEPFRSNMQSLGTLATYAVPIFIETEFWGAMFMDYCRELRQLAPAELAVFNTAATCIGSAIHREQMRCDREKAERDTLLQQEREQAAQRRAATLETYNRQLQRRDRLLNSVNAAAQSLVANEDLETALPAMLQILGEGTRQCRAYILRISQNEQTGELLFNLMLEWDAPQIPPKVEMGACFPVPVERFPEHLTAPLKAGRATQFLASVLDGLSPAEREPGQALSLVGVPITVGSEWWGLLGLDDCIEERIWSDAEIAVLETAAAAVGGALERDRSRKAREAAEKAVLAEREKAAQERAAELAKTNEAISKTLTNLATNPELDNFLSALVQELSEMVGAANTGLFLHNAEDNTLYRYIHVQDGKAFLGPAPRDAEMLKSPFPADLTDIWRLIQESPQPITFAETGTPEDNPSNLWWKDTIDWHISEGHRELACARLKVGDIPLGFIGFCFREHRTFSAEQFEFIQALANQATLAIHLTRLAEDAKQTAILQEQERAAQERVLELAKTNEAIAQSLTSLAANPELDTFLGAIIAEMARQLNACKVHLFLYDEHTHTLTQRVTVQNSQIHLGAAPNDPEIFSKPIPADTTPGWNAIINSERPLTYDETLPYDENVWWPETIEWHRSQGHKAVTCIPMKAGDTPIGFIGFCFYDRTFLSDEQLEFMQALANQAIVAIQLTRLADEAKQAAILQEQEKAARERVAELAKTNEAISQTLDALTTEPELDRFLGQILTQIVEQIGADDTHLFLYDAETHTLRSQLAVQNNTVYPGNAPDDPKLFYTDIPADITAAWQILIDAPKPVTLDENHPESAEFYWPTTIDWHTSRGHQSATCACMKIGNQPIGFIGFAFCDRTVLSNEQLEFVQALTNQATLAIHLTRLAEESQDAALLDERNRLAREIHDTLAQAFTGISLQLEAAKNILTRQPEAAQTYLDQASDLTRQGLSEARRSVQALRSQALETETLANALQTSLTQMTQSTLLETQFQLQGTPIPLSEDLQLNLLRIGQEAITNTLRHAQAHTLTLTLTFTDQQVSLRIADDGVGFDTQALADVAGFGLIGIRERAARYSGQVQIHSHPEEGTTIEVTMLM